jgi:TetR/AcrR family transcriptional repressor of nem operon
MDGGVARSKDFEPRTALSHAMLLFWQKGYLDTSIDDLVQFTGVSRYGLYSTFGDKRDLFLKALRYYSETAVSLLLGGLERPEAGLDDVRGYFDRLEAQAQLPQGGWGCLIANTAVEVAPFDSAVSAAVQRHFDRMRRGFGRALSNAQADGSLAADFDVAAYADFLVGVAQGIFVMARAGTDLATLRRVAQMALARLP